MFILVETLYTFARERTNLRAASLRDSRGERIERYVECPVLQQVERLSRDDILYICSNFLREFRECLAILGEHELGGEYGQRAGVRDGAERNECRE